MKYIFDKDHPQQITEVTYAGRTYGITYIPHNVDTEYDGEIGVFTPGDRRIKYMRVKHDYRTPYGSSALLKSYIRSAKVPEWIYDDLILSAKLHSLVPESVMLCEHVLKYGRCKR